MKKSFIAISSVLIIAAVVLTIGITVSLMSIGEGQSALSLTKGEITLNLGEGCMEDALLQISKNSNYSGGMISQPEGICTITVLKAGNSYTVTSTNTATDYRRTIQAVVNKSASNLIISSWKEI